MTDPVAVDAGLMAEADRRCARLRHEISGVETPAMRGDCLAVMLASDFEAWADEDEETDDSGTWKRSAVDATDGVIDAIVALCRTAIYAALQAAEKRAAERMRERAAKVAEAERDLRWPNDTPPRGACESIAAAIRALPLSETETKP